jgi:hypothetical protein
LQGIAEPDSVVIADSTLKLVGNRTRYRQISALYPFISQLERAAGFAHDDAPQAKLNKLDTLLGQSATLTRSTQLA